VLIPASVLLGEENRGWYIGTTTLDFERSSIGTSTAQTNAVEDLVLFIRERGGEAHPTIKLELAERQIEAETARLLSYRVITLQNRGQVPNHEASAIKLYAGELGQRIAATGLKVAGLYGQLDGKGKLGPEHATNRYAPKRGKYVRGYLNAVAGTIAGGTSEVQRGIIAGRGLGLPRG
jgi:alkylation response protein AidB-like acyl-CoA dehydrogenase